MYYANISVKESSLKDSMKFYHMVLKEDQRNIYAANGLGMVCAAKDQGDIAREIFSRVRETGLSPGSDVCVNLGHMHLSQGRYVDAIQIYQATLKSLPTSPAVRTQSEAMGEVSDCLSLSYLKNSQHDDSVRVLLKSLHYDPTRVHDWFNVACVKEELAVKLCRAQTSSISDISLAIEELNHATLLFKSLRNSTLCPGVKRHELFDAHKAGQHEKFCLVSSPFHHSTLTDYSFVGWCGKGE
jgi:tetratricopeptide (TPR) repeat protein